MTRAGFVALAGWTNVGKSTLLNRLVGEKVAAVAASPQTTRTRIVGVRTIPSAGQIVLVDAPGFHHPRERMNRGMIETARKALEGVDVALLVVDAARGIGSGDASVAGVARATGRPLLVALNKIDLVREKGTLLPMMRTAVETWGGEEAIPVSALTGEGCEALASRLLDRLPPGPFLFPEDQFTELPERALAAEWIREKVARHTREEIPHASAVLVERWKESDDGRVRIEARILVERDSQRPILLGKGGQRIKAIGIEARQDIEKLLGVPVTLLLHVEVRKDWRNEARTLRELGLV